MGQEGDRHQLSRAQAQKESVLPGATTRVWQTARYPEEITRSLEKPVPQKVLVIGCGVDEAAVYADVLPHVQVMGVDFNQTVIEAAQNQHPRENVCYLKGDILDSEFVGQFEKESFGAIVLTGVLTNLVHEDDITHLFQAIDTLLAPQGRVIVSDYLLNQEKEGWEQRYMRDLLALLDANYFTDEDSIPYGTWVSRPFGKPVTEAYLLPEEEIVSALISNNYERLVRHWHPILLMKLITRAMGGGVRMKFAEVGYTNFDPHVTVGELGWLTTIGMVLEKKAERNETDLKHEEAVLYKVQGEVTIQEFPPRYDEEKFFEELVDETA